MKQILGTGIKDGLPTWLSTQSQPFPSIWALCFSPAASQRCRNPTAPSLRAQRSGPAGLPYLPRHPPRLPVGLRLFHGLANLLHQLVQFHRCFRQDRAELLAGILQPKDESSRWKKGSVSTCSPPREISSNTHAPKLSPTQDNAPPSTLLRHLLLRKTHPMVCIIHCATTGT